MSDFFAQSRSETRGIPNVVHLNNAGAALLPACVVDSVVSQWKLEEQIGGYEAASVSAENLAAFYESAARLLNCDAKEIAFVDSATRAWNSVLYSIPFHKGEKIITSRAEFGTNVVTLQHVAEVHDLQLVVLDPDDQNGSLATRIEKELDDHVRLVAITQATAHSGLVQDVVTIGRLLRSHRAVYLVDACQAVGQFPIDVREIGCDALVATGRKWLRGPRGTGFLYVTGDINRFVPVTLDLANTDWLPDSPGEHSKLRISPHAKRFELWERSMANQIGLATAIKYYLDIGPSRAHQRILQLRKAISDAIDSFPTLVQFPTSNPKNGIITFYSDQMPASDIKAALAHFSINVSVIHDWDAPWDFAAANAPTLLRISPHYFNTIDEVDALVDALARLRL